jgi:hypothetical protein
MNKQLSFSASKASARVLYRNDLTKKALEHLESFFETQPWIVRLSKTFSAEKYKGDIANVIITGLGTGIVAPLMIKFNPLSKEDQDTKTYAAWRQPISAVIAVITQVGITKQVGNIIEKMAASGDFGKKMDTSISDKYLRKAKKYSNISDDLAVIAEKNENKLKNYLDKKYNELQKAAEKLRTDGKYSSRLKIIENKVNEIKEIINDPEKANKFILNKSKKYSKLAQNWENKAKKIKTRIEKYKDLVGIGIALLTLPLACGLLNWVYPRFMKMAFPELSNKKAGNKKENSELKPAAEVLKK